MSVHDITVSSVFDTTALHVASRQTIQAHSHFRMDCLRGDVSSPRAQLSECWLSEDTDQQARREERSVLLNRDVYTDVTGSVVLLLP